jgi:hypothetical protein
MVEKPEGKRPLGRPRFKRKDNIKIDFRRLSNIDYIHLSQDRSQRRALVNT